MPTPEFASRIARAAFLALVAVAFGALAACSAPPTDPVAAPADEQPAATAPVAVLSPTAAAAAVPVTPTLPAVADPSRPVSIVLRDFAFDTSAITFTTGVTYQLVITNTGAVSHELRVLARGESQMMMDMGVAEHMEMGHGHEHASQLLYASGDELPPGAVIQRALYFERPGEYEFGCHMPAHLESGMLQFVEVVGDDLGAPLTADDITVDTESMHDMPCHRMGTTIMGDCSPDDIERFKQEILGTPTPAEGSGDG